MSFHDLINTNSNPGGPHGCIAKEPVIEFRENKGLSEAILALQGFVIQNFPNVTFSFGDVISLAGKVSVEIAFYPCVHIPWRFGRYECIAANETQSGTNGSMNTLAMFAPYLERYNLTAYELAILTAGSHGIQAAGACSNNTGFGTLDFTEESSGKAWLQKTFGNNWTACLSDTGLFQYCSFDTTYNTTIMRLPSDMVFVPSIIQGIHPSNNATAQVDHVSAVSIEKSLQILAQGPHQVFDGLFSSVYAKMLEIGVKSEALTPFIESYDNEQCSPPLPVQASGEDNHNDNNANNDNMMTIMMLIITVIVPVICFVILLFLAAMSVSSQNNKRKAQYYRLVERKGLFKEHSTMATSMTTTMQAPSSYHQRA